MTNKKRRIGAICILIFTFLLIFFILYQKEMKSRNPITATAFKLNTVVTVTIYDSQDTSLLDEALAPSATTMRKFSVGPKKLVNSIV